LLILFFFFLIFPWFNLSFLQKILRKRRVFIVDGKKILPNLSFLSLFSFGPIHLFLKHDDWGKEGSLLQAIKKIAYFVKKIPLFSLDPIHLFLEKDRGNGGSLLQAIKKYCLIYLFFPYFSLDQIHLFFKKCSKKDRSLL
jgi:hypothetical protein